MADRVRSDAFFGLEDRWVETAPGEVTHFHEAGEGTPVVFVHGSGAGVSAAANWWLNLPEIGRRCRTLALDLIGFGQTQETPDAAFGVRAWSDHVIRFLDALDIEAAWLVGNSLGGWVSMQVALDHPERLLGIVSMGTGGAARTKALASHARPDVTPEGIRTALEDFVVDKALVTDALVQARYRSAARAGASERFGRVIRARDRDRSELPLDLEELRAFERPVLLVHGVQDVVIPVSRTFQLAEVLPHADVHLFSQCGHWSQVERAEDFNWLVAEFVDSHTGHDHISSATLPRDIRPIESAR